MPRDGSGNYTKPVNSVDPAVPATTIASADFNQLTNDLAAEMTDSLDRSGKGAMLAALAMGANKITNLGAPSVASDAARFDSVTGIALVGDVTGTPGANTVANVTGGKVAGLAAGSFAPAGKVGEVVTSSGSVALANGVTSNLTSVALTAGNWIMYAGVNSGPAGATTTQAINACISTSSAVLTSIVMNCFLNLLISFPAGQTVQLPVGCALVNISNPTTYYLNGQMNFALGAMNLGGVIFAIRLG